jgi:hypothetical protein
VAGLELTEILAGRLRLTRDGVERPMVVTLHARTGPLAHFRRRPTLSIEGVIEARGLAERQPFAGAIDAARLFTDRRLGYAFTFLGDDGAAYAFTGAKTFARADLVTSFTLLVGAIHDARGDLAGEALLRFDLRGDLVRFAKSFRAAR